jgi:hypothetical protein
MSELSRTEVKRPQRSVTAARRSAFFGVSQSAGTTPAAAPTTESPPPSVVWSPDGSGFAAATRELGGAGGVCTVRPDGSQWTLRMTGQWSWLMWPPLIE